MDWMSALSLAVLVMLVAEGTGALFKEIITLGHCGTPLSSL